jgi:hypothetical protein
MCDGFTCWYAPEIASVECGRPADYKLEIEDGRLFFHVCERCARLVETDIIEHGPLRAGRMRRVVSCAPPTINA